MAAPRPYGILTRGFWYAWQSSVLEHYGAFTYFQFFSFFFWTHLKNYFTDLEYVQPANFLPILWQIRPQCDVRCMCAWTERVKQHPFCAICIIIPSKLVKDFFPSFLKTYLTHHFCSRSFSNYKKYWKIWEMVKVVRYRHKGQLISEWIFGVFKSPKKPTKFYQDFCPMKLGQKSW